MKSTRRSRFAIPLVLVVGCGSAATPSSTPATTPPAEPPPAATPAPLVDAERPLDPPGSGQVTKTVENGVTILSYESGEKIYVHADGTCIAEYGCAPRAEPATSPTTCNPPAPQRVTCPPMPK